MSAMPSPRWISRGFAILLAGGLLVIVQSFRGTAPLTDASAARLFHGAARAVPDLRLEEHPLAVLMFQGPDPAIQATMSKPGNPPAALIAPPAQAAAEAARRADEKRRTRVTRTASCDAPMPADAWLDICDSEHIR